MSVSLNRLAGWPLTLRAAALITALACACLLIVGSAYAVGRLSRADAPMLAYTVLNVLTEPRPPGRLRIYDPAHQLAHTLLTTPLLNSEDGLSWSPDGSALAILSSEALYVYHPFTGALTQQRQMRLGASAPRWSPDGAWLAYNQFAQRQTDIYTLRMDGVLDPLRGDAPRNLSNYFRNDFNHQWSPDGAWIAWQTSDDWGQALNVARPDGSAAHNLLPATASRRAFTWSPDGTSLAVLVTDPTSRSGSGLFLLAVDDFGPDAAERLVKVAELPPGTGQLVRPLWSPDGTWIAFFHATGNPRLYRLLLTTDAPSKEPLYQLEAGGYGSIESAAVAPDGRWLAIHWRTRYTIGEVRITLRRADGHRIELYEPGLWYTPPLWRP